MRYFYYVIDNDGIPREPVEIPEEELKDMSWEWIPDTCPVLKNLVEMAGTDG